MCQVSLEQLWSGWGWQLTSGTRDSGNAAAAGEAAATRILGAASEAVPQLRLFFFSLLDKK